MKVHPSADVQSSHIGEGTVIWQYVVVLPGAVIGRNCNINCHSFIENDVVIGDNVTIKSGTYLWDSIRIEDDVFVGPNVVFTNDIRPRSKQEVKHPLTVIKRGASLGANSTILAGVTIGQFAMSGIGSVITRDVPDHALVFGNPAKVRGWVDMSGQKLEKIAENLWQSSDGTQYTLVSDKLERI
jgi:acetyltransferase-like isoleucine patch superfamily enzyme